MWLFNRYQPKYVSHAPSLIDTSVTNCVTKSLIGREPITCRVYKNAPTTAAPCAGNMSDVNRCTCTLPWSFPPLAGFQHLVQNIRGFEGTEEEEGLWGLWVLYLRLGCYFPPRVSKTPWTPSQLAKVVYWCPLRIFCKFVCGSSSVKLDLKVSWIMQYIEITKLK